MRFRRTAVVLATAASIALTASPAHAAPVVFRATLTGAAVPTGGDPAGSGFAVVVVDDDRNLICAAVFVTGSLPADAAHIHRAPAGVIGPHAVDLLNPVGAAAGSVSNGCYTAPEAVLDDIVANPSNYYVNVHNPGYPLGSVRGQLA